MTKECSLHSRSHLMALVRLTAACLATLTITLVSVAVGGEVSVRGDSNGVQIDVKEAKISEVLSELGQQFGIRYSTAVALDAVVDGCYSGSLKQVLARLLDGHNYVMKNNRSALEVVVIGKRGSRAVVHVEAPKSSSATATWRTMMEQAAKSPK